MHIYDKEQGQIVCAIYHGGLIEGSWGYLGKLRDPHLGKYFEFI